MALTSSPSVALGTPAPDFELPTANPNVDAYAGDMRTLASFEDAEVLAVVFTCNHCPYAVHVEDVLIETAREFADRGVRFVAISSNDAAQYPDDGFEKMRERAREHGYPFPYLYDATQEVAAAYGARCTPELFLYDADRRLCYHGRVDESRPGQGVATGRILRKMIGQLLKTGEVKTPQKPALGCGIKWIPGNEPPLPPVPKAERPAVEAEARSADRADADEKPGAPAAEAAEGREG